MSFFETQCILSQQVMHSSDGHITHPFALAYTMSDLPLVAAAATTRTVLDDKSEPVSLWQ